MTSKKHKIDFVCHAISGGGAERVLVLLAEKFAEKHDVRIITFNESNSYSLGSNIEHVKLHKGWMPNHTFRRFLNLLSFYRKRKNRPDITIGFITRINLVSILVSKIYSIKAIGCEHNNHLSDKTKITRFTRNNIYKHADLITILTQFDAPFFEKRGANVKVVYNPATYSATLEPRKNRNKNILVAGNLNKIYQKGWDNLIPIVGPLLKKHSDWKLLIAGEGEKGKELLKNQMAAHQVDSESVEFLGFTNKIGEIMGDSEIFLMVSRYEGLPMVLIEAMSQGMACISYNCLTGPSEIITKNKNGILIEDQNSSLMRESLDDLMSDSTKRIFLGQNAPKSTEKFNMSSVHAKWEEIFEDILC
nr:glycosyltransferase family 4 protein [uncultured Allomuricauda sp.]